MASTSKTPSGLPEVDPRVKELFINNLAKAIADGADVPPDGYKIPAALRTHGYTGASRIMGVADHTVRHYWQADLLAGRSQSMPQPDVIITRIIARGDGTEDYEVLPGWTERTIREWMPVRVGTGNHTRGEARRGNSEGRRGWSKATALERAADKAEAAAAGAARRAEEAAQLAKAKAAAAREARAVAGREAKAAMRESVSA